jgi:hypothetical protein
MFASVVSYAIRTWTWHKHRIYIDIGALQISLLGGRIFFTALRYHGPNETFLVQHGYITWRYWLRRVREADILVGGGPGEDPASEKSKNAKLPCRINVNLIGLEWFVYNRSPVYDSIVTALSDDDNPSSRTSGVENPEKKQESNIRARAVKKDDSLNEPQLDEKRSLPRSEKPSQNGNPGLARALSSDGLESSSDSVTEDPKPSGLPFMLQLFPIHVECRTAAAVIGNENTKGALVVKSESVAADIDASETSTPDPYRQLFKINFQQPVIEIRENEDFKEEQAARATRERYSSLDADKAARHGWLYHQQRRLYSTIRRILFRWPRVAEALPSDSQAAFDAGASQIPGSSQWQGLSRYLDDQYQDDKARWSSVEYASETEILHSPSASLTVYWDVVGKVTRRPLRQHHNSSTIDINGAISPAWGMHFSIHGGEINYGPWADRRRADLQRVFFPSTCKDASVAKPLQPGAWRAPTQFELLIELEDSVTMRVPFREESKNWRWRGQEPQTNPVHRNRRDRQNNNKKDGKGEGAPVRPTAWLEAKVGGNSTIKYRMDMLAVSPDGFQNSLHVELSQTELRSTVNQDILWKSDAMQVSCDLTNPLSWNALRHWRFNIDADKMELYLLRDHIFLLVDLVDDWTSGPPPDYLVFTPFKYLLNMRLRNMKLYLNVNDGNIIDKATALDENAFILLASPLLQAEATIPIDKFRPDKNSIPFDVRVETICLSLHTPQWTTQSAFIPPQELGTVRQLGINGSYHYNATTSPANTDTLILNIYGHSLAVTLYGFVIRYFILLKDNYFGEHVHFRTLDEYQKQLRLKERGVDETPTRPPNKKSNDLDVILGVKVNDPRIMLPTNLYSSHRYVQGELATLSVDLRFTNYYMDLELDISPLKLSLVGPEDDLESPTMASSNTELFIDGLRVYGHRLFGLPPTEPTYLCNWDVSVGDVLGDCSADFLSALAGCGAAFGYAFDDVENALVPYSSLIFHDVTFARVLVKSVRIWLHVEESAFLLSTDTINIASNDWARSHYSKRADVIVPNIEISCVDSETAAKHKSRRNHPVQIDAFVRTDIRLSTIGRKFDFTEERSLQQELVRREDQRTNRTPFLLIPEYLGSFEPEPVDSPAQCSPLPPHPLMEGGGDKSSGHSVPSINLHQRLSRQSSFLSLSSSSTRSVRRSRSNVRKEINSTPSRHSVGVSPTMDALKLSAIKREQSSHSSHHSGYIGIKGEDTLGVGGNFSSMAFSSQYFVPHFGLQGVQLDTNDIPGLAEDEEREDFLDVTGTMLDDIDPTRLSEEHAHSSILVEFPKGLTAVINPSAIKHATSLLGALQPREPEDALDSLQVGAMSSISDSKDQRKINGTIKDILVRLPKASVRFLNSSSLHSPNPRDTEQDQYDIQLSQLALVTRTSAEWGPNGDPSNAKGKTSLRMQLSSASLSASERLCSVDEPQAAMMVQIDGVMASVGSKDINYVDVDIGPVVGSTASGKIEYMASLIHRTGNLATELQDLIEETTSRQKRALQHLTYRLLEEGRSINDPSFMTRPSAVLRSVPEHLRTYDSWKLAMRLRQIWRAIGPKQKSNIVKYCWAENPPVPLDAANQVISAFQRWRGWDLEDMPNAVLLKNIFGQIKARKTLPNESKPTIMGAFKLAELRLILDPGPKENRLSVLNLSARLRNGQSTSDISAMPAPEPDSMLHVLGLYCSEVAINLNWELCELVDDVARLYARNRKSSVPQPKPSKNPSTKPTTPLALHVVLEVDRGSFELETINLNASAMCDVLKTSLLYNNNDSGGHFASMMLNCGAVASRLQSHTQLIGSFQLLQPSVYFSHELQEMKDTSVHTIKASASSQNLKLAIKQDPIVLLEILDLLLRDEVAQLYRLQSHFASTSAPAPMKAPTQSIKIAERLSSFKVNVALFLDRYTLSMPLLQSLTYKITGSVARASCAANFGKEIIFDFDVKENSHEMQIDIRNKPHSISLLQIPPTNGRITSQMQSSENILTVLSSVELIQLDASAVYSLLSALNRPQISSAIEEVQEQTKAIQKHMTEIFGEKELSTPTSTQKSESELIYNVHLTLAGLQVSATTPQKLATDPIAQVMFSLEKIHLQAANRHEPQGSVMKYPELHVNIKQIGLYIRRGTQDSLRSCGSISAGVTVSTSVRSDENGKDNWTFNFRSPDLDVSLSPETMATAVEVLGYLTKRIKDLDTSRELEYLRKLRQSKPRITIEGQDFDNEDDDDIIDSLLSSLTYHFELQNIQVCWNVANGKQRRSNEEDLALTVKLIDFGTRTRHSARLTIEDFQLQMTPPGQDKTLRSLHSALLPEVVFNIAYVTTPNARRLAFQAVGQSLDLRLTSDFIIPAAKLADSISLSVTRVQETYTTWGLTEVPLKEVDANTAPRPARNLFSKKRLESLLIDADFAGAVVHVSGKRNFDDMKRATKPSRSPLAGKYGQFSEDDSGSGAVLRSPGLAWKFEFADNGHDDPTLSGEVKIDASSNILHPSVVPLIIDIVSSVKQIVSETDKAPPKLKPEKTGDEENLIIADPSAVLGRLKLNLGLRISRQEFSLSCQPIARVAATACFDGIYFTVNTVYSQDHGNFFAISGAFTNLQASVQHVYSRESTGSFDIENITLSLMNSKHVSGTSGVSAILNVSPTKVSINAKQVQDFLLFREIWYPRDLREASTNTAPVAKLVTENSQGHLVQRYQQVAATAAFPWTATISIAALDVSVDLGQSIGRSVFAINDFWILSKKTSDWEQTLCLGFKKIGIDCTGRLSGFVALQDFRLRTSIHWPKREEALNETPLVQGSIGFNEFRLKAAFDYQSFLVADITSLEFLMYNVRESKVESGDRLVAIFDGEAVQVFGTTTSTAQAVALYQAFKKLIQEKRENFESSLKDIEKFMRRKSSARQVSQHRETAELIPPKSPEEEQIAKSPISLDTDVVVTLKALNLGVFPSTFSDKQIFKIEALNAYARFAASIDHGRIHSILKLRLGQLRIGLAGVRHTEAPKTLNEISVDEVVKRATGSRGGTILKVPQVSAVMETWQTPDSNMIDYIFKSAFEGKVEVGWNYSRISFIRGMLANHSKSLEQTWGRELPMAAVKITGVPEAEGEQKAGEQQKITAEVNVPLSKYTYIALEPPVIETPQLRDMGEATPPLEWIGLHRDRLPNLTHQIVIVSLLELAGEVEDAYARILGSS